MDSRKIRIADYRALAEFRHRLRRFLRFSEEAARKAGLEPQQHQLLLAVKGLPRGHKATIGVLAERLQIQHHSAVELVDRLVERGLVRRFRDPSDRRQVFVRLRPGGEKILRELSIYHLAELSVVGPDLVKVLKTLIGATTGERARSAEAARRALVASLAGAPKGSMAAPWRI
ncbi:MAG TPA: MarR family transcriptional regulator [Candidatus Acidoferrales bacterium]|nr:MarR family transcriptional regulator [Candidatus Acidoferrales bacterium]